MLSGGAGSSPGLSETRVQPPRYSAVRIGTVVHRAISRLFENCLPFEGGKRMPLHRLFEQRGENFVHNGLMPRNSFALCRYSAPTEPRTFLSEEELRIFQTSRLKSAKHECHRGLFLFSRFTEICYKDMRYLTCEQIIPDTKGHLRIHGNRCKTGGEYTIKFLPAALRLLEKYRGTAPSPLAFDMPKLSSINCSLRRITKQCGISRHITFHAARHTFATTLCLSQGIPLSTVSKMLGHKQITTTQIYAQTTPIMIEDAIDRVESRLDGKFAA